MRKIFGLFLGIFLMMPTVAAADSLYVKILKMFTGQSRLGGDSCWFCGVFENVFDIMNAMATRVCEDMQGLAMVILGLGFLFWLVFRVGKVMLDLSAEADTKLLPDVIKQTLKVGLAFLMLTYYLDVFHYAVNPILQFGLGVGNQISMENLKGEVTRGTQAINATSGKGSAVIEESSICAQYDAELKAQNASTLPSSEIYPDVVKEAFLCYLRVGSTSMLSGMAVGATAIFGWTTMGWKMFSHVQLVYIGFILMISFFALFMAFPFKLFDPLINLTFVTVMYPFWVAFWPFAATKKYADKAIELFIGVVVNLIALSILSYVCINIMNSALAGGDKSGVELVQALIRGDRLVDIFEGSGKSAVPNFSIISFHTLKTVGLGFFAFQLFQKSDKIAGQFGSAIDFGMNGAAAGMTTKGVALTVSGAQNVGGMASKAADTLAPRNDVWGKLGRGMQRTRNSFNTAGGAMLGGLAAGPVGAAIGGLRSYKKQQQNVANTATHADTTKDASRASLVGRAVVGKGNATWFRDKDKTTGSVYRLDTKTNKHTRQDENGQVVQYEQGENGNLNVTTKNRNGSLAASYQQATHRVKNADGTERDEVVQTVTLPNGKEKAEYVNKNGKWQTYEEDKDGNKVAKDVTDVEMLTKLEGIKRSAENTVADFNGRIQQAKNDGNLKK